MWIDRVIKKYISLDTPYWLQELAGNLFLYRRELRNSINIRYLRFSRFLKTSQWFSCRELLRYQLERLQELLHYAYKNVPYYTEIFRKNNLSLDDFNSIRDLRKFPILTKGEIVKNFDKLIATPVSKKYMQLIRTSGSTGTPLEFYRDRRDEYIHSAFNKRLLDSFNLAIYDRNVLISQIPFIDRHSEDKYIYDQGLKLLSLSPFPQDTGLWSTYITLIKHFKPVYITGSPSSLYYLGYHIKENNMCGVKFRVFISSFENLFPYQREFIERQFGCKVYNYYLSREHVMSGFECLNQDGLHLDMERGITEVVDDEGRVLSNGLSGRIIATGFYNFAMPFIRYDTKDIGALSDVACPCGRGLLLLKYLEGRTSEVIKYNNKCITASALAGIIRQFSNIKECQFIQEKDDRLLLNIIKTNNFLESDTKEIVNQLHNKLGAGLDIKINFVEDIPRTKMGKFPFVVSKLTMR